MTPACRPELQLPVPVPVANTCHWGPCEGVQQLVINASWEPQLSMSGEQGR